MYIIHKLNVEKKNVIVVECVQSTTLYTFKYIVLYKGHYMTTGVGESWISREDSEITVRLFAWLSVTIVLMFILGWFIPTLIWFGLGGLMVSSKQKFAINYYHDLEYTNEGIEYAINAVSPLYGWVIEKNYHIVYENFDDSGTNGADVYFSYGLVESPYRASPSSELGLMVNIDLSDNDWYEYPELFEEDYVPADAFGSAGNAIVVTKKKSCFNSIKRGQGIGFQFKLSEFSGITWTTGDLKVYAKAVVVVGAFKRGRSKGLGANARPMEVAFMWSDSDPTMPQKHFWFPPSDGRINNIRATVYDKDGTFFELNNNTHFFLGVDVPENIDQVMSVTANEYQISPVGGFIHFPILDELTSANETTRIWGQTIHNKNKVMFLHKNEPFYVVMHSATGAHNNFLLHVTFDFIANYQNQVELVYEMDLDNGDKATAWYKPFNFDMYLDYIDIDYSMLGTVDAEEVILNLQLHILKDFDTPSLFTPGSATDQSYGSSLPSDPFLSGSFDFSSSPSTMIASIMIGSQAGSGVSAIGLGSEIARVTDYIPQKSTLLMIFFQKAGSVYALDVIMKLVGKGAQKHNNWQTHHMKVYPTSRFAIMNERELGSYV